MNIKRRTEKIYKDWDIVDKILSNNIDAIITKQNENSEKIEVLINDLKYIKKTITENQKLIISLSKQIMDIQTLNYNDNDNNIINVSNSISHLRLDNVLWRKYCHKGKYNIEDPSFGTFISNMILGKGKAKKKINKL